MTKIIAHMVTFNEMSRHLEVCIEALLPEVDSVQVFDDRSTDDTAEWLEAQPGVAVIKRSVYQASFLENEGKLRQAAWDSISANPGDIILCVDADELVSPGFAEAVESLPPKDSFIIPIREVFDRHADGMLMERIDGEWGAIHGCRIVRYQVGGVFADVAMGGGSVPVTYRDKLWVEEPRLIHLGYMRLQDRLDKFARYSAKAGTHASHHINSIITAPRLRPLNVWL